jgi:hypothetical protein
VTARSAGLGPRSHVKDWKLKEIPKTYRVPFGTVLSECPYCKGPSGGLYSNLDNDLQCTVCGGTVYLI